MQQNSITVKILTIIGFSATILIIGWALFMLITKGHVYFVSLAQRVETLKVTSEPEETPIQEDAEEVSAIPVQEIIDRAESGTLVQEDPKEDTTPSLQPITPSVPLYSDLAITTLGNGTTYRGKFSFESEYRSKESNALMIDIQNKGTLTSGTWVFSSVLEDKTLYTSPVQAPLRPGEHAVFTIPFDTRSKRDVNIWSVVHSNYDALLSNNVDVYEVRVD